MDVLNETPTDLSQVLPLRSLAMGSQCEGLATETESLTDATQLMEAIAEDVSALFGLSIAARRASNRDRYTRALEKIDVSDVLPEEAEIERITGLFPTLRFPELRWLKIRLVTANNRRRRYLKYCQEHQKATAHASEVDKPHPIPSDDSADATSIGAATRASTVADTAFYKIWEQPQASDSIEEQSIFSYDTQTCSDLAYVVPDLGDMNGGSDLFLCPFCRVEVSIRTQHAWKKHVFKDLKAYVCTSESCNLLMFESSHQWLAHMLSAHLKIEKCPYCSAYDPSQDLNQHMQETHPAAVDPNQIPMLLGTSMQELDKISVKTCQFCDWHTKLSSSARKAVKGNEIFVPLQRYRRHVGAHLEEIALSTITEPTTAIEPPSDAASEADDDMEFVSPTTPGRLEQTSDTLSQTASQEDGDAKVEISANHETMVKFDLDSKEEFGLTRLLLDTGKVDINSEDNNGRTALSWAAENGDEATVKLLLDTGKVDINSEDNNSRTALSWAVENGDEAIVKLLLDTSKVDVESRGNDGQTALSLAAKNGHEALVKLLLDTSKVDVNSEDNDGRTALSWAVENGDEAIVKLLLDTSKVDMESRGNDGQTALSLAAKNGHEASVKRWLDTSKVGVDSEDIDGRTS
jgi:hypothetical protein